MADKLNLGGITLREVLFLDFDIALIGDIMRVRQNPITFDYKAGA